MNKLKELEKYGFKITWKLISIGLFGFKEIPQLLTYDDIFNYFDYFLANIGKAHVDGICVDDVILFVCEKEDLEAADKLLKKYSNCDKTDITVQIRKWRVYLLQKLIDTISQDCLQGLLELIEFWISIGRPQDCPFDFPNVKEGKIIDNYFTLNSYNDILNRNRTWIDQEIAKIIKLENK